ncbi:hypothetical protein GCM10010168_14420 [Actinoplanes ianthinogenes]|uniref:Fimbrial assembly protein n=1 Tax=Actinoplanes ianthinogenes TaxID=122358 RepID=A0ABM7LZ91_9ACTN|nr:hypothetical protein [Actinoplanes ianthinogenes]BCJ44629.1 hypothetical protein Aiant_52860 [Actinoplanes ianthinogenes]GGQ99125.1 hypothetical protein GCM10010168_14420 [Actinoplanes ianthinogenes]
MSTALMPLDPSVSPQQASRVLSIRANLLPQDITDSRRARRTRAVVLLSAVLVLAALSGWYWQAATLKQSAEADFEDVTRQVSTVQKQQTKYTELTQTKNTNTVLSGELAKLMAQDLSWQAMLDLVRTTGEDAGADVSEVSGTLLKDGAQASSANSVGQLSISGTATDKKAVAKYIEALLKLEKKGLTDPFVSNVSGADDDKEGVTYSLTVSITAKAFCGQWGETDCTSGGK